MWTNGDGKELRKSTFTLFRHCCVFRFRLWQQAINRNIEMPNAHLIRVRAISNLCTHTDLFVRKRIYFRFYSLVCLFLAGHGWLVGLGSVACARRAWGKSYNDRWQWELCVRLTATLTRPYEVRTRATVFQNKKMSSGLKTKRQQNAKMIRKAHVKMKKKKKKNIVAVVLEEMNEVYKRHFSSEMMHIWWIVWYIFLLIIFISLLLCLRCYVYCSTFHEFGNNQQQQQQQ